jgi:hypothetical protein
MKNRARDDLNKTFMGLAGWLFADLLLALAMLFLIASTVSHPETTAKPRPTPTPTIPATPTQLPRLELFPHRVTINVSPSETVQDAVRTKIQAQTSETAFLQGRRVGLVIIFTGAPTTGDIPAAQDTDETVKHTLQSLRSNDFANASYYDSTNNNRVTDLTLLGYSASHIVIDIYLFSQ